MTGRVAYELVPFSPEFREQVLALRRRVFGGGRRWNEQVFAWKYEANPYISEPLFTLALDGGRLVGMRGFYGGRWVAGASGASVVIPSGADTAVDPGHRGRWLFEEMARFARDDLARRGYEYSFNFSSNEAVRTLSLRMGWRQLGAYRFAHRPGSQGKALRSRVDRLRGRVRGRLGLSPPGLSALDRHAGGEVVVSREARPDAMAALVARRRDDRLAQVRDAAYYRWRFAAPGAAYRFLYLERGDGVDGFLVAQEPRRGGVVSVVDWCAADGDGRRALWRAVTAAGDATIQTWTLSLPAEVIRDIERLGLRVGTREVGPRRPPPGMLIDATSGAPPEQWALDGMPMLNAERWDLRMLDSDSY